MKQAKDYEETRNMFSEKYTDVHAAADSTVRQFHCIALHFLYSLRQLLSLLKKSLRKKIRGFEKQNYVSEDMH